MDFIILVGIIQWIILALWIVFGLIGYREDGDRNVFPSFWEAVALAIPCLAVILIFIFLYKNDKERRKE